MANTINRLSAVGIKSLKVAGRYSDGQGLYLHIRSNGQGNWIFRYRDKTDGRLRDKGLGLQANIALADARDKARECREQLAKGIDPIDQKQATRQANLKAKAKAKTFGQCVDRYIAQHGTTWRNEKHKQQWRNTLDTYAAKLLPLPVADIDTDLVMDCLSPIWKTKTETATRVRQRIENVLDYAKAAKLRTGENPALWRGHLKNLLAAPAKLKDVQHHAALPYRQIAAFVDNLESRKSLSAKAVLLQIYTASRSNEVVSARWNEIDLAAKVWTIPKDRMKANREHRVPLAKEAIKLLKSLPRLNDWVFPSQNEKPLTIAATLATVKDINSSITTHGFRSTFRDWAAEHTAYAREVAEAALAHALKDKTEAAYFRSDLFDKRALMLADWARYCHTEQGKASNVTPIKAKRIK